MVKKAWEEKTEKLSKKVGLFLGLLDSIFSRLPKRVSSKLARLDSC